MIPQPARPVVRAGGGAGDGRRHGRLGRPRRYASPALPLSGDGYVAAGDTYTLTLGSPLPAGEGQGEGSEGGEPINLGSGTDVSYTINWNDGTPATTITADDLAAAGDQVTHVFNNTTSGITVHLNVAGDPNSPYTGVSSLAVNVDTNTATTIRSTVDNPSPDFGDAVTLTATVAGDLAGLGAPTGTVEFYDNYNGETTDLGPGTLSNGVATLSTPRLGGANGDFTHTFTAVYSGDDTFQSSTSAPTSVSVTDDPAGTVSISPSSSPVAEGTYVTLNVPTTVNGLTVGLWTIGWGDGTAYTVASGGQSPALSPTLRLARTYTITAIAEMPYLAGHPPALFDGTTTVTVTQAVPSITSVTADNAQYSGADTEDGGAFRGQLHVSFTGPASQKSYTVTINRGGADDDDDGTTTFSLNPGETSFVYPLPQYAVAGTYPITLTVTDAEEQLRHEQRVLRDVHQLRALGAGLKPQSKHGHGRQRRAELERLFTEPQFNIADVVTIDWGDETAGWPADTTTIDLNPGVTSFQAEPNSTTYARRGNLTD